MLSHGILEEFQCRLLVAPLCHKAFQDFAFVIDGPPKIVPLTVDLYEHLVQVPALMARLHPFDPALADLRGE